MAFDLMQDSDPHAAVGRAVLMLNQHASFSNLHMRQVVPLVTGQVNRGHYLFVTRDTRPTGYLGWALSSEDAAETWLASSDASGIGDARTGDCVVFNTWVTDGADMISFVVKHLRAHFRDKHKLVARRHYEDGRIKPFRIHNTRLA